MKNCWTPSIKGLLAAKDGDRFHVLFRYTRKNEWSWRAPQWLHSVVGWSVLMPCLVVINVAVFALRGRWLHAYFDQGDGAFMEYAPHDDDYVKRRFPALSFDGQLRDSGKRLVCNVIARAYDE